jgi:LDH2 family malate/lactate/ureidoglycolate dehydrogenase
MMTQPDPRVAGHALLAFIRAALLALGLSAEQAGIVADAWLYSELRFHPGQGQGVTRLRRYKERIESGLVDPRAAFEVIKESPALALIDAHDGIGAVTAVRAMRLAVAKAKICGIGTVIVRNGTHYGSSSVPVAEAVADGCLGIAFTNAGAEMAAWGGASPAVGTNPWAIGAPADRGFPVMLDIALTTAGKGMMRWMMEHDSPMPRDWALTPDGQETDDPAAAMTGALLGIGQYKGYGLSMMTDVLTGVLSGGGFGLAPYSDPKRQDVSHSFTAIDIAWFMPLPVFTARIGAFIDEIKAGRRRPGVDEILVPGEIEHRRVLEKTANGVPLPRAVLDDLRAVGRELGLAETLPELAHG